MTEATATPSERLSERELCPDQLIAGQEAAFARDVARLLERRDAFVAVPCPACGADPASSAPGFSKMGFTWLDCTVCRTLYMSPRPTPPVMADYYAHSENYAYWARHIFPGTEDARREKINRPWLDRIAACCATHGVPTRRLLEVGGGFGVFAELAQRDGRFEEVLVVEPTPEMATAIRARGVSVLEARIEDVAPAAVGPVDVIVAFEVIEHLFAPRDLVDRAADLLAPNGLLVVSCPNGLGFDIQTLGAASLAVDPEHVNLMNPASLSSLLESRGFEVVERGTPGRLDVEFVHDAIVRGDHPAPTDPFLRRVLVDEYDALGWAFQQFLAAEGLSSHMWIAARYTR
ncbi:MAG: class I SAM-dependent methyltransferase [Planctomycetota bacterium]|jgi:SAM-dependent methyltransferase